MKNRSTERRQRRAVAGRLVAMARAMPLEHPPPNIVPPPAMPFVAPAKEGTTSAGHNEIQVELLKSDGGGDQVADAGQGAGA